MMAAMPAADSHRLIGWLAVPKDWVASLGDIIRFCGQAFGDIFNGRVFHFFGEALRQAGILILGSALVIWGMVFILGLQCGIEGAYFNRSVGAPAYAGVFSAWCDLREMVPYMFGYIMAAKVGTGIVAELGAMRINEEIDALEVMGVRPITFLAATRLLAAWMVLPFIYIAAVGVGFFASYLAVVEQIGEVSSGGYFLIFWMFQNPPDLLFSVIKGMAMATAIVAVGCYYGYTASGGPVGVGQATAKSMILNMVLVHLIGMMGSQIFWGANPEGADRGLKTKGRISGDRKLRDSEHERQGEEVSESESAERRVGGQPGEEINLREGIREDATEEEKFAFHGTIRDHGREDTVEFIDVVKSFGRNTVLDGLNLGIPDGMITMILGPSGTGKSVCIKHMVGLLYPDEGDVLVHGRSVPDMTDDELFDMRKKFGVLFQDGALFGSMNLYDNVAFPLRQHTEKSEDEIRGIVSRRLKEVGLGGAEEKMPNELSGGMRKRAGFARALVLDPEIVLFDEPDSGLDPVRTALLCDLIKEVHEENGGTYVVITHDIASARRTPEYMAILWRGKIVEAGLRQDLFESENKFVRQFLAGESAGPLGME